MTGRRTKVLEFLATQEGQSFDGSVSDLAADLDDPSPQALSATVSVLVKEGLLGREPEGVGVVATRLWLRQEGEQPRDTPRAEPEVERCAHGIPVGHQLPCGQCKAAERQRKSRATRRADASEAVEEPEAPAPHVCGPECTGDPTHLVDEPEHDGALPSDGPVVAEGGVCAPLTPGYLDAPVPPPSAWCNFHGFDHPVWPDESAHDDLCHTAPEATPPSVVLQEGAKRPQLAVLPVGRLTAEVLVELCDNAGCLSLRIDTPWPLDPGEGELVAGLMERVGAYYAERARMEGR